jgi:hypothetical protein
LTDLDFAASIVVYEEDFADSNDTLLAQPVHTDGYEIISDWQRVQQRVLQCG